MPTSIQGVPPKAQPWARGIESQLGELSRAFSLMGAKVSSIPDLDKTVVADMTTAMNISQGTSGRVEPGNPVAVRFVSSTGLFEVNVSLGGLVRDGGILGAGFESDAMPYEVSYDIPKNGVVSSAPIGQTAWSPFSASTSTVVSARPGVQNLNLYLYAVCTAGANSAAYVKRARLTVKAV